MSLHSKMLAMLTQHQSLSSKQLMWVQKALEVAKTQNFQAVASAVVAAVDSFGLAFLAQKAATYTGSCIVHMLAASTSALHTVELASDYLRRFH